MSSWNLMTERNLDRSCLLVLCILQYGYGAVSAVATTTSMVGGCGADPFTSMVNISWCTRLRAPGSPEGRFFLEGARSAWHIPASRLTGRTAYSTRATLSAISKKAVIVLMDRVLIFSIMRGFLMLA